MIEIFATRSACGRDFGHQGVAGFVIGDDFLFFRVDDAGFALESGDHPVDGLLEVDHLDRVLLLARGAEGGLVDEVGEVGADEPGRAGGNLLQIDVRGQRHLPRVHLEDLRPALQVGPVEHHLAVEAAGAQQRRVQDLRPVGGGQEDDAFLRIEAIHLRQELIQGLFPLIVAAHHGTDAARLPQGIQLVDEDDARGRRLRLREEVAHAGRADADEHLDEVGTAQAEEGHPGFPRHRLGQEGLAGPGGADEQHPLGDLAAEPAIVLRALEEIDDFHELGTGLVDAGHIVEGHARRPAPRRPWPCSCRCS